MDVLTTELAAQPFGCAPETKLFVAFGTPTAERKLVVGYGLAGRSMVFAKDGRASRVARTEPLPSSRKSAQRSGSRPIMPSTCRSSTIRTGSSYGFELEWPPCRASALSLGVAPLSRQVGCGHPNGRNFRSRSRAI